MKKMIYIIFLFTGICVNAQVAINTDNTNPDPSSMLDVKSTTKGFLAPRMTFAERNAIASPAEGLVIVCTNCKPDGSGCVSMYLGGQWLNLVAGCNRPAAPTEGIHVQTNGQIIWNWDAMPIVTLYKWGPSSNSFSATNMGTATSETETLLTNGASYTRYVWALNACGLSDSTVLTGQAMTCGSSFTITHPAGSVAPVTKTVTYGTVTNIPGETSKCWITRNLGATHQPNTVNDNTEASAGWYWQFNLKQGYKHDGIIRTPFTNWISPVSGNSDWTSDNDPCSLLLGSAWRIPTHTEWANVNATGNWTSWNGPFSSGLQMHAAGFLVSNAGIMASRGAYGFYWSSNQYNVTRGWGLDFHSGGSSVGDNNDKASGYTVRCVRD